MGKVKVKKTKKKLKVSKSVAASLLNVIGKKGRGATGKHSATGANGRPAEAEQYSVVPFDYNIQAQIDWLTAPPSTSSDKKSAHVVPPPSKKPQRGYHKDVCEACGESEYLMYCDKCPSAYHAICDDPPVPFEDYEVIGLTWKCKKCRSSNEQDGAAPSKPISGGDGALNKLFQTCLPSIQNQNPVQFKLPKEMPAFDYPFPGTSRHILKKGRNRTSFVIAEKGVVPRPTVLCYHCHKSCRVGALIQCDKCDLFFHLDCLDPPLTTIPPTVWICPLHVEPYLESTQLTSVALSERIKIWDDGEKPVNRSAIICSFIKKAARKNPMFKRKKLIPMTLTPEIPEMVQNCYKEETSHLHEIFGSMQTLAAACEVERLKVEMEETDNKHKNKWVDHYLPLGNSLVQQRAKLEYLRSQNQSKLEHLRGVLKTYEELEEQRLKRCQENGEKLQSKVTSTEIEPVTQSTSSQPAIDTTVVQPKADEKLESDNPVPCDGDVVPKPEPVEEKTSPFHQDDEELEKVSKWVLDELKAADEETNEDLKAVTELTRDVRRIGELLLNVPLTDELCNNLANKNLVEDEISAQITNSITAPISTDPIPSSVRMDSAPSVYPKYIPKEPALGLQLEHVKSLPRKTQLKLAACHIRYLRRKREIKDYQQAEKAVHNIDPSADVPGPRPLISFFLENICLNVEITKRSFWIGSGDDCDWKITDFVKCNRIDSKHAKMFYNSTEQCWEILNYSPQGLYVNNTLFGCKSDLAYSAPSTSTLERISEITEINSKRIDEFIRNHNRDIFTVDPRPCFCKPFPTKGIVNVYEGSAKVLTGHKLQIGCAKISVECMLSTM